MAPPAVTVRFVAENVPSTTAFVSTMVIFVPQALTVLKSFVVLPSVIFPAVPEPELVKLAVPVETFAGPV